MVRLADMQRKVRDLELSIIDSKASTERMFNAMRESITSKLERDVKTMS